MQAGVAAGFDRCYNVYMSNVSVKYGYLICALAGYLLGSVNFAYIIGKWKGRDIRRAGSHNAGATNLFIVVGFKPGLIAAIGDILKAVMAVGFAEVLFPEFELAGAVAGASCLVGHAWPFWMGFRGGKGFASYLGIILAFSGLGTFFGTILWAAIVLLVGDKMVLATVSVMTLYPMFMYRNGFAIGAVVIMAISSGLMIFRHRANLKRLVKGEEFGLRQRRRRKAAGEKAEDDV